MEFIDIIVIGLFIVAAILAIGLIVMVGRSIYNLFVCKHNYKLVNTFIVPSEFDMVHEADRTPNSSCSLTRKLVTDYTCGKCGKIKRLTVYTYH